MEHEPTASKRIAAAVADAIDRAGLSQRDIARATGIKRATLSRRLAGVTPLNVNEIASIADALGVKPSELTEPAETSAA